MTLHLLPADPDPPCAYRAALTELIAETERGRIAPKHPEGERVLEQVYRLMGKGGYVRPDWMVP